MFNIVGDTYGLIHFISSLVALISGALVLYLKKGTRKHRQIGYVYVVSMGILIITSFMIYRLFEGWGIFHYAAVGSLLTIGFGMIPMWTKRPTKTYKQMHFAFMYWSVVGLYAAFAAEVLTRIPGTPFFWNGRNCYRNHYDYGCDILRKKERQVVKVTWKSFMNNAEKITLHK